MGDITPKADAGVTDEERQRGDEESNQINELCQHNSWVAVFEWEWRTELGETGHTAKGPEFTDNDGQGTIDHGIRGTPEFRGELEVKVESPLSAALPLRLQGKAIQGTRWFRNKNLAKADARSAWLEAYYPDGRPQRSTQKTADDPFRDLAFTRLPYDNAQFTQFSHMDGTLHKKETELKDFLNAAFLQAGLSAVPSEQPCNAIISVRINVPKGAKGAKPRIGRGMPCAFVRFRTPQEATRGLHLDEIVFKKHSMHVARVRSYEAAVNEDDTAPDTWPEFMEKRVAQQPELEGRVVGLAKPGEDITRGEAHGHGRRQELSQLEADLGLRPGICLEWGVCVDWLRGECSFGDQCKFLHAMPEGASSPAQPKVLPKEEVAPEPEPEPEPESEPKLELEPESSPEQQPEPEISGSPRTPPVTETVVPEEDDVQAAMEKLRSSPAGKFYTESQLRNAALRQVARQQPEPTTPPAPKTPPSRAPPQAPEQAAAAGQEVAAKPELDAEVTALLTKTHLERYAELLREHGLSSMAALMAIKSKQDLLAVGLKIGPAAALHRKLSGTRPLRSRFPPSSLLTRLPSALPTLGTACPAALCPRSQGSWDLRPVWDWDWDDGPFARLFVIRADRLTNLSCRSPGSGSR